MNTVAKNDMTEQLMQFLMGLDASFDHMRRQILLMDPLPSVYRAYSAMLLVEKPRNARHEVFFEPAEIVNKGGGKFGDNWNSEKVKVGRKEKVTLQCDYCKDPGHEMSDCFKLHGYPDRYKNLKEQKGKYVVNKDETPLDFNGAVAADDDTSKMVSEHFKCTREVCWV